MILKFDNLEEFIAGDGSILRELYNPHKSPLTISHSLAHAKVLPKSKTMPHALSTTEVYVMQSGNGLMHIDNDAFEVSANDAIIIPPNSVQFIENNSEEDLTFFCIVEPAWKPEDELII